MRNEPTHSAVRVPTLQDVLVGYLQAANLPLWPGTDALSVREVLLSYPQAVAARLVPGQQQLLCRHPELADELQAFFADQGEAGSFPGKGCGDEHKAAASCMDENSREADATHLPMGS